MPKTETPEERKQRLLDQLAKGRETRRKNREAAATGDAQPEVYAKPKRKPKNLDKIIREILDDDELIDKVVANQPEQWNRLPVKNGGYIISVVMMVKAMGGDIRAADWIRKTGFGDKVMLEDSGGFFAKSDFTIQVIKNKDTENIDSGIKAAEVIAPEIKQIEE